MSNLSFPSDTDNEGKPPKWRHWWDRTATPRSSSSPLTDGQEEGECIGDDGHDKEGDAVADDGQDEDEEKEEDEDKDSRWRRLVAEEVAEQRQRQRRRQGPG
jgi:hypothetical protein